jgi:microcystin-dependent protein
MSLPFLGEIRMFAGNFAPQNWAFCNGQLLSIAQNTALFALIGTTYGGNGTSTFGLPDLRSRIPVHQGTNPSNGTSYILGQAAGEEQVMLMLNQIPSHSHPAQAQAGAGDQPGPGGGFWASSILGQFSTSAPNGSMTGAAVLPAGGNQAHNNIMPYLAVNFIIALEGIFPSQN